MIWNGQNRTFFGAFYNPYRITAHKYLVHTRSTLGACDYQMDFKSLHNIFHLLHQKVKRRNGLKTVVGVAIFGLYPFHGFGQSSFRILSHRIHDANSINHFCHKSAAGDNRGVGVEQVKSTTPVAEQLHSVIYCIPCIFRKIRRY